MDLEQNPVFRKEIIPWYDSNAACLIAIFIMFLVFIFGLMGFSAAREHEEYNSYMGIPIALIILSGIIIVSITIRLIRRNVMGNSDTM